MQPNFSFQFAITIAIILNFSDNSSPMECVKVSKFDISPYFPLLVNICAKSKLYMCMLCGKLFFSNFPWQFLQSIYYYALPNQFSSAYDPLPSLILYFAKQRFNYKCNRLIVERKISTYNLYTASYNNVKRGQCHFIHILIDK